MSTLAARRDDGEVGVLVWNGSLDQSRIPADPLLARDVTRAGRRAGRPAAASVTHWRVDEEHSNVFAAWRDLGGADRDWPRHDEWAALHEGDRLAELEPARTVEVGADGVLELAFRLPQPGISYLALR